MLPVFFLRRKREMAPMGNAAAFPEHLAEGNSTAQVHWCTARSPDVSFRGAKRRGNLAEHGRTTGKPSAKSQLPSRDCHVGLRPPRNDKSEAVAILTAVCTDCKCVAGSGMPLPYIGRYRFNGGRYKSAVPGRAVPSPTFAPSPSANLAEFSGVFRTKCSDFPHLISLSPVL